MNILEYINTNYSLVIWVTVVGKSNALSGVVAANTHFPVMTVLNVNNLAESCGRIFNMSL